MQFECIAGMHVARSKRRAIDVEFHFPTLIGNRFIAILRTNLMRYDDNVIFINDAHIEFKLFGSYLESDNIEYCAMRLAGIMRLMTLQLVFNEKQNIYSPTDIHRPRE